jgi:hypothetical protein
MAPPSGRPPSGPIPDTGRVFAVQCPNPRCRKYMLVEEYNRGKVVACLLCKAAIRVGDATPSARG